MEKRIRLQREAGNTSFIQEMVGDKIVNSVTIMSRGEAIELFDDLSARYALVDQVLNRFPGLLQRGKDMIESHPADDPKFNQFSRSTVWYMAHPLATDDKYTRGQNMAHVLHMVRLFFSEGIHVVAPYHTIMLVFDDHNSDHRRIGLETDLAIVEKIGRIILCGHKISRGMHFELEASRGPYVSLVGKKDSEVREWCRQELIEEREFLRSATDDRSETCSDNDLYHDGKSL